MTYEDLITKHKDNLIIEYSIIINDSSLRIHYSIKTNLHSEFGICGEMMTTLFTTSKTKFNRRIAQYRKLVGFKPKLFKTDNSNGYTRLFYRMQNNKGSK